MTGVLIETTLELWASSLRDVEARMRGLFTQSRVAISAGSFLDRSLSDERRKTGWMRAKAAGDPGPWRQQPLHHFGSWADKPPVAGTAAEIARHLDPCVWQHLSAGKGTKGARLHDWAYLELPDLDAADYDEDRLGVWPRGLLIRRNIADGDVAFFTA